VLNLLELGRLREMEMLNLMEMKMEMPKLVAKKLKLILNS